MMLFNMPSIKYMELNYTVKYSKKRKRFGISIERDRSIVVHAPVRATERDISDMLERNKQKIYKHLLNPYKYPVDNEPKLFASGASLLYMGKNYQIDIAETHSNQVRFTEKFEICPMPIEEARKAFKSWFMEQASIDIAPVVERYAKTLGVQYQKIRVSDMSTRWGSCSSKGNLNFNYRLIKAPLRVLEYVVVHELAHLIEFNHSPDFWDIVAVQIPDYQKQRDWLKKNGSSLEENF